MELFPAIGDDHRAFIARQPVFFVGTAAPGARVNVSPKGMDTFRILNAHRVAYLDFGGSGNETNAHLLADGRITTMFCAFDRPALILRLYGRGRAVLPQDDGFAALLALFPAYPGVRQVFVIDVDEVQTTCGWGVPQMMLERERPTLAKAHAQRSPEALLAIMQARDRSLDGLPVRVPTRVP